MVDIGQLNPWTWVNTWIINNIYCWFLLCHVEYLNDELKRVCRSLSDEPTQERSEPA